MSSFDDYLKTRYEDQIGWYEKKSGMYKKKYQNMQRAIIVLSAITPILAAVDLSGAQISWSDDVLKVAVVLISALVAIYTSLLKVFRYYENWINYRNTSETLKKEIFYFDHGAAYYKGVQPADKEALFVERVESILADENKNWKETQGSQTN